MLQHMCSQRETPRIAIFCHHFCPGALTEIFKFGAVASRWWYEGCCWALFWDLKHMASFHFRTFLTNVFLNSSVQFSRSVVSDSATPWTAARQASLSITNSRSTPRLMSIELVMPSSHLILCCSLLLLPPIPLSIRAFPVSQLFTWGGQSIEVSALASFLPKSTQDWSPLGWKGWISV